MPEESGPSIGGAPELPPTSESEQMYLITVARATERGAVGPVPMTALATTLDLSVASANEMIRKLAAKGLVLYVPYRGVELTELGSRVAGRVLRTRRLWATFLADHLGFTPVQADALACNLEHVTPDVAAERLAVFLGDPPTGPLGEPIPSVAGEAPARMGTVALTQVPVGAAAEVVTCLVPAGVEAFLGAEGITPGVLVRVLGAGDSGVLVDVEDRPVHIASEIAGGIETSVEGAHVAR